MNAARLRAIAARRDVLGAAGEARLREAQENRSPAADIHPAVSYWMTQEERAEDHALLLEWMALEPVVMGHPSERIRLKRALTRAGVEFERTAPICELRRIFENSACTGTKDGSSSDSRT